MCGVALVAALRNYADRAVPRYFFDLILGSTVRRDHTGVELADVDAARRMALARLAEATEGNGPELIALEVLDARSVLLARISIVARAPQGTRATEPGADSRSEDDSAKATPARDDRTDHAAWLEEQRSEVDRRRAVSEQGNRSEAGRQRKTKVLTTVHLPQFGIVKVDDNLWSVIDLQSGSPALYDLRELIRLPREEAEEFADRMNFRAQSRALLLGRNAG